MQLPNPKELRALLKVCRDFGVDNVEVGELKIKFGDMPKEPGSAEAAEGMVMGGPTEEELAFWSTQPDPKLAMMDRLPA